jgi:hypothetical protein
MPPLKRDPVTGEKPPNKRRTHIRDPQLKKLRALKIAELRVLGKTIPQVAKAMGLAEKTVDRTLSWAKRAGVYTEEQDIILQEMVPLARNVLLQALREGDVSIALEVYKGTELFGRKSGAKGGSQGGGDEDELERWINSRRRQASDRENSVDGELLPAGGTQLTVGERKLLPAAGELDSGQPTNQESGTFPPGNAVDGTVSSQTSSPVGSVDGEVGSSVGGDPHYGEDETGI